MPFSLRGLALSASQPEEICQRGLPFICLEPILLLDPNPRQLLPSPRQLVAAPRQLLLFFEQSGLAASHFSRPGLVLCHRSSLLPSSVLHRSFPPSHVRSLPLRSRRFSLPYRRRSCTAPPSRSLLPGRPRRRSPARAPLAATCRSEAFSETRTVGQNLPQTDPGRCPPARSQCRQGSQAPRPAPLADSVDQAYTPTLKLLNLP